MALFVDGPILSVDELQDHDSGLLDVAATCGINVTTKIRLAHEDVAAELRFRLERPRSAEILALATGVRVDQVVVGDTLRRWEALLALSKCYDDAYSTQLVDRYQAKAQQFAVAARMAFENCIASGVGVVAAPVRQASTPVLGTVTGPQEGGTFYASVAWVNSQGQEGAASPAVSATVSNGYLMTVSASGAPTGLPGFNVYVGAFLGAMTLQNTVPLAATDTFTYVPGWSTNGRPPSTGQPPEFIRPLARYILRG
jgi:hypothetical protein